MQLAKHLYLKRNLKLLNDRDTEESGYLNRYTTLYKLTHSLSCTITLNHLRVIILTAHLVNWLKTLRGSLSLSK